MKRSKKTNRRYYLHRRVRDLFEGINLQARERTVYAGSFADKLQDNKYIKELIGVYGYAVQLEVI